MLVQFQPFVPELKYMRTFVIGDIHGAYRALVQVLERASFDYANDKLICLGDVADGWSETYECFEHLFKIKNLEYVMGNHDYWLFDWLEKGASPIIWTEQGGKASLASYMKYSPSDWKRHKDFLAQANTYYWDKENRMFVHAAVSKEGRDIDDVDKQFLCWDRWMWDERNNIEKIEPYKEIYVGHTSIYRFSHLPLNYGNVWFMDTGCGWEGKLSMMDIDSKKVYQSDEVKTLYPNEHGR